MNYFDYNIRTGEVTLRSDSYGSSNTWTVTYQGYEGYHSPVKDNNFPEDNTKLDRFLDSFNKVGENNGQQG